MTHRLIAFPRLLALLALSVALVGCAGSQAATPPSGTSSTAAADTTAPDTVQTDDRLADAVTYATRLTRALDAYEAQRQAAQEQIRTATDAALNTLQGDATASDVRQATEAWRAQWADARQETHKLDLAFADVEAASARYFNHLERQTSRIASDSLRGAEQDRNDELEHRWRNATIQATHDLNALRQHVQAGNDLYVAMLNASLRSGFDRNLNKLQSLSDNSRQVLSDLQALTAAGQTLVIGDPTASDDPVPAADAATPSENASSGR